MNSAISRLPPHLINLRDARAADGRHVGSAPCSSCSTGRLLHERGRLGRRRASGLRAVHRDRDTVQVPVACSNAHLSSVPVTPMFHEPIIIG